MNLTSHITGQHKIELLAPAGSYEKLKFVLHYGADAVYLAGKAFSLRNYSENFDMDQMEAAIHLAHSYGAKCYVAVNIFARNQDLDALERYIQHISRLKPDGIIIADPAVVMLARRIAPALPIHLSTQANTTNGAAADFWHSQGVQRINLARELTLAEIAEIAAASRVDIEIFVHGAMCISYSGRCLLSNYMAQRPSNQGACCQPCRFQYAVMEALRPGEYFPVAEDDHGTYIFNSRDLCMLPHLPDIIRAGVRSVKIEGRMKGIHYAATSIKIYREAIDRFYQAPDTFEVAPYWQTELDKISIRSYCTGFYYGNPDQVAPRLSAPSTSPYQLVGNVIAPTRDDGLTAIEVRNRIRTGDRLELVKPKGPPLPVTVRRIMNEHGRSQDIIQAGNRVSIVLEATCEQYDLLRIVPLDPLTGNR
jgi:putative protease